MTQILHFWHFCTKLTSIQNQPIIRLPPEGIKFTTPTIYGLESYCHPEMCWIPHFTFWTLIISRFNRGWVMKALELDCSIPTGCNFVLLILKPLNVNLYKNARNVRFVVFRKKLHCVISGRFQLFGEKISLGKVTRDKKRNKVLKMLTGAFITLNSFITTSHSCGRMRCTSIIQTVDLRLLLLSLQWAMQWLDPTHLHRFEHLARYDTFAFLWILSHLYLCFFARVCCSKFGKNDFKTPLQ